ncbi:mycothiol transferase [Gracilibacillus salinarum]|uniref:DinB family protein n=1 Tax=Gracilibacillus salinarum TaxID=2932255 RepID=A0ABY4GM39_9BACI|nr:DUF664 domain-containing protein [Gracilibacillus salinarum]UOQ85251.1 DinB family protein [Gracilibacillus salinarum]
MAEVELTYVFLHARFTTLNTVKGLTVEQLDYLPIKEGNSIGALLLHMAAVEFGFQIELFDKRNPNKQESEEWGAVYQLGELGRKKIKGNPLELYIEKMDYVKKGCVAECVILIYFICLVKLRK